MQEQSIDRGADTLVRASGDAGVTVVFSLSGNQIMPVYDALLRSGIRLVHVRHEATAVYMAEAWAQVTGQLSVALVTAGAGFGSALGAPFSAWSLETPVLLRSWDSPRALVELMCQADRVLLLGRRKDFTAESLDEKVCAATARFAAIDPEVAELDRIQACTGEHLDLALRAEALPSLRALMAEGGTPARATARSLLERGIDPPAPGATGPGRPHPAEVGAVPERVLAAHPDIVLVCDGGEFGQSMRVVQHVCARVVNGVSAAVGAAPAYAMGPVLARPGTPALALMGDGTAGFLLAKYETAAREGLGFTAFPGNDALWNAEHQIQVRHYGKARTHGCALSRAAPNDRVAAAPAGRG